MEPHIVITPEILTTINGFPLTNTLLVSYLVTLFLIIIGFLAGKNAKLVPTSKLQNIFEIIIDATYTTVEDMAHSKAKTFFPWVMTFFLFIITANWLGLFPGFSTIGFNIVDHGKQTFVPILRSINSDLNMTLALAIVSVLVTHFYAIKFLGILAYLQKWFSLNPIFLFVGLLELVSEFTKVVSLSFRLFGNIFAGEVVLATVAGLSRYTAFLVPLPFYFLEIIVGFVQAAVFMMLTLVFMSLLSEKHESH